MIDRDEAEKGSNQVEISRSSCTDHVHYQPQTSVFYTCWLTAAVSVCMHYFSGCLLIRILLSFSAEVFTVWESFCK